MELTTLSATELLSTLDMAWSAGNRALAKMLAYLGEVERRGLYVEMACTSMFAFLERRFNLTGGSAYRRLTAARLVRRFPTILARIEEGDIHLETLCALKDVLTEVNVEELMVATAKKTMREVEHIIACRAPKPDVEPSIRKLPERSLPVARTPMLPDPPGALFAGTPPVAPSAIAPPAIAPPAIAPRTESTRPRLEQLSQARHKLQLTVSSETRAKVERARDLMKHRNPSGDLEVMFDRALDALLEKLEKERLGKTSRPQKTVRPSKPGRVPAAARREVFERDGEQCTHVDVQGNRCGSRTFLELDHVTPRARGGPDEVSNLRVVCRAHNRMAAERMFGKDYVASRIEGGTAARRAGASGRRRSVIASSETSAEAPSNRSPV
jgi:hypothetical protein